LDLPPEPVHRDRQRLVRLLADGAVGHRAGGEALDDLATGLDLVERSAPPVRPSLNRNSPRSVIRRSDCSSTRLVYCLKTS
jgi:hypothetical protein